METVTQQPKTPAARPAPAHEQVYRRLREQVLFGDLIPGQPVTIQGLTEALGAGMTPVREAIRRLISDGALAFQGNRRVSVPTLSAGDLDQLLFLRKTVESELVIRASRHVKPAVIDELTRIDARLDDAIAAGDVAGYLRRNYQFHAVLYAQAQAPVLAEMTDRLWLRFGPSLRVVCGRFGTQNLPDRHKELMAALADGDATAAARAIVSDVEDGMEQVAAVLTGPN
ncbi:GntR family transcriptional regulator [Pukyongiella litopenaei]|uniref:GntR family transcriptional regulator n=1 Tax=Pukyongiella litopenaei TaxID=2605946 RepID=A0A2S0MS85_9RHOB|nr:GntR family transcriptional regulator [Pukyongiella litopenaei]AVO38563.1 GntR family transcriptional regulator [Pukyongiella litopenaei]